MTYLKTKFKIFPIILVSYFSIMGPLVFYLAYNSPEAHVWPAVLFLLLIVLFWFTVLRTRAHSLEINEDHIIVRRYFGIGKSNIYKIAALDGFMNKFESAKGGVYESVFIFENGKRIGSISNFYHKNFEILKLRLQDNLLNLGETTSAF
ncbi:hypothetical protein [Flavobacterium panacagri]|uniref:hypothetical protein n=1 Tax=Flavobacterium panacagri TaxID=3034146 RepID=UPI0025A51D62|nr:hypothetical protein [Flavobacterium panacagri]